MRRFRDIDGDLSTQLAPWTLLRMGLPMKAQFRLEQPLDFYSDIAGGTLTVPKGYESDLASIPAFAWSFFLAPDDPRIELGAWVHDLLYQFHGNALVWRGGFTAGGERLLNAVMLTRAQCDAILAHEAMPELSATPFQCTAVYQALRCFGDGWPGDSLFERLKG